MPAPDACHIAIDLLLPRLVRPPGGQPPPLPPFPSPAAASCWNPNSKNAPTPSRETLASAPAGYLDLPVKEDRLQLRARGWPVYRDDLRRRPEPGPHTEASRSPQGKGNQGYVFRGRVKMPPKYPELLKRAIAGRPRNRKTTRGRTPVLSKMSDEAVRSELQNAGRHRGGHVGENPR